jgi:hypothetical protein
MHGCLTGDPGKTLKMCGNNIRNGKIGVNTEIVIWKVFKHTYHNKNSTKTLNLDRWRVNASVQVFP